MDLAGRLGGDEFIAFLQQVKDEASIREKTAYLNEQLLLSAKEYMGEDMGIPLGASIGAVFVPEEGVDFSELFRKADQALYAVKNGGKHGVAFYGRSHFAEERESVGKGISRMRQIMGERNPEEGAFLLDFERFQGVYRFVSRGSEDCQRRTQLLHFTLQTEQEQDAAEQFRDMLRNVLGRGDCLMQNGAIQFFALLADTGEEEGKRVKDRIYEAWNRLPISARCSYVCEMECMGE